MEFPVPDAPGSSNSNSNLRDEMLKTPDAPPLTPQIPSQSPSIGQQERSFVSIYISLKQIKNISSFIEML